MKSQKAFGPALLQTSLLAAGVIALVGGCARRPIIVQSPAPTVINQQPVSTSATPVVQHDVIVLKDAPPAPKQETPSAQPSPENVWISGYWGVSGNERTWVAGHWENPPRPGAVWVAPRWERRGDGYAFIEGSWR